MEKTIELTNYTEKYNSSNFFNYSCRETDINVVFGKIINKEVNGEDTIVTIEPDKYGRIGYFYDDVLYSNGNLTGTRGVFHLEIDKEKMEKVFKNGLFHCYESGTIVNNIIDDPENSVHKRNLVKINNSLCIFEPKEIPLDKAIAANDEQIIIKNGETLEIVTYIRFPHEEAFNYYRSADGYHDTEQTYWTLEEIYVSSDTLEKINSIKPRLSHDFRKINENIILGIPYDINGDIFQLITLTGIFPIAVADILWNYYEQFEKVDKNWLRELREKSYVFKNKKEKDEIKEIIKNVIEEKVDCYNCRYRILFLWK